MPCVLDASQKSPREGFPAMPIPTAVSESTPHQAPANQISTVARLATLVAIIVPFLGLVTAIVFLWGWGFRWVELGLLLGMYVVTALGITVGFHRLFTHRAFETNPVIRFALAVFGSMAVQGSLRRWVAQHRRHHQHSDTEEDPHSP